MPTNHIDAWSILAAEASAFGRTWGRYGAPSDAVEFRTEAEASLPAPPIPAGDVPDEIRSMIIGMDEAIRAAGMLPEPCSAWIGLELPPEAGGFPLPLEVGRHFCLVGFVSASLLPSPAVFAAGPHGALLHVRLAAALPMTGELQKPGEMELVPPRNSCFRVKAVHRDVVVADEHGRPWERSVVEVVQVGMDVSGRQAERGTFTAPAARRWRELGPQRQTLFLNNVYCGGCRRTTTLVEPSGRIEGGDLVLQGTCLRCGGAVCRVVEGG